MSGSGATRLVPEVDLDDKQKRLCLRVLSAFSSRAAGMATPSEVYAIVCDDGYGGRVHYEQVRILIANFLVPNGFVSIGRAHERNITDKGRELYHRLRASVRLPSQVPNRELVAPKRLPFQVPNRELVAPNLDTLVGQIGQLIKELTQRDKILVLSEALRRFC